MVETARFFVGRLWLGLYVALALIFLLLGILELLTAAAWWGWAISAALLAYGSWNGYVVWLARTQPILTIDEDAIEARAMVNRASTRIRRVDVEGVAWSSPGDLGLRLRSGDTARIALIGLTPSDKASIQELLAAGRSGA